MLKRFGAPLSGVPMLGWLAGALVAVLIEVFLGQTVALLLGLGRIPLLFGVTNILKEPLHLPGALVYVALVYLLPTLLVARFTAGLANRAAGWLLRFPMMFSLVVHLGILYLALSLWAGLNDYRLLLVKLMLIAIMITLSLNLVNGYMGEFSCSHPGFMALGAYGASVLTVLLFVDDRVYGAALLPPALGPFLFPLALIAGGAVAAIGALVVAIPSFRTRGDYLAIISLAFLFIVKSLVENLEIVGGPRGFMGQPDWANLPTVFIWAVLCVGIINSFVRSTMGKALNAVRDDEIAANAMTVNTRKTKMIAFLFAAFWAGVAGGLFAHVMRYVNPGTFGVQKLAESLAMLYFGGLNSVIGSIAGAVGFSMFSEALRPLEIYKWIIIPVLLILVMIFRPTGLIAFRDFDINRLLQPKTVPDRRVGPDIAGD
ncbi:MAG: branched-chain amino acid ABC transporter permease [Bacillota bacterium]